MPFLQNLRFSELSALSDDQLSQLADLHRQCFEDAWSAKSIRDMISGQGAFGHAAFLESDLAGFSIFLPCVDQCELVTICTSPERRSSGLGRKLVDAGLNLAAKAGFTDCLLEVASDNAPARHLYESAGFTEDGTRKGYYLRKNGPPMDAVLMSKPTK